jgi:hypothetical protein
MPERIRLSRQRGWRMPPDTAKVDRATRWGNPFLVGEHGDRAACVARYRRLLEEARIDPDGPEPALQQAARQRVVEQGHRLRGLNLACWCPLPEAGEPDLCHAAVLLDFVNR